jgi:long-chain fatty acid transport protein
MKMRLAIVSCVLALCTLLAPRLASAQFLNYQSRLIGQRASGMGGAYTALSDDPTATFYNPGGLGLLRERELEVGLPILEIDYHRLSGSLIEGVNGKNQASDAQGLSVPSSVGVAAAFGPEGEDGRKLFVGAVSLYTPYQRQLSLQETRNTDTLRALDFVNENEQTVLVGPSLGVRLGKLSVGVSLFYVQQNFSWFTSRSGGASVCSPACGPLATYAQQALVSGWEGSFNLRLGALLPVSRRWRLGAMLSASSLRLFGTASILGQRQQVSLVNGAASNAVIDRQGLATWLKLPWELRLGAAFVPLPHVTLSFDLTFYAPENFSPVSHDNGDMLFYPGGIYRRFIANANAGLEFYATNTVSVRAGVFTNLSAANPVRVSPAQPGVSLDPSTAGCVTHACSDYVNSVGLTASVGVEIWSVALTFGANGEYGRGYKQIVGAPDASQFAWATFEQLSLEFFIGGNLGKFVEQGAQRIEKRVMPMLEPASRPAS